MKKLSEIRISKFQNMTSKVGSSILLFDELKSIKTGTYKSLILQCRTALANGDKELYDNLKSKLPAVTFCGEFNKIRKASEVTVYNNLMIIDIDHLDDDVLEEIKKTLKSDDYVLSLWESPSGKGLKCLIKINSSPEKHRAVFNSLKRYFLENYNIDIDVSGKDISRLCFSSWDENIYFNINSQVYVNSENEIVTNDKPKRNQSSNKSISLTKSAYATEGLNKKEDREIIKKVIKYLTKREISITSSYDEWLKVAFAIASTFSYDIGEKYFLELCKLDKMKHNEEKSVNLLKSCYNKRNLEIDNAITLATILYFAKNKGFVI